MVGAHLDSINPGNIADAPGADDDASGVAAVSEVLRAVLASGFTPKRTLQFMAYAAEEVGLRGSTEIAEDYAADPSRKVVAALQMDMTGFAGSPQDMYFITDYVSADLTEFLKDLIGDLQRPRPARDQLRGDRLRLRLLGPRGVDRDRRAGSLSVRGAFRGLQRGDPHARATSWSGSTPAAASRRSSPSSGSSS